MVDAVRCAIEVQSGMVERNMGLPPEKRIEFRVGVHLGDVVEESDGDLMGDGVNIAARLKGIAAPGAICLSEDAYRQVQLRLDLAVTDLGPTQLKKCIAEPIRVYSLEVGVPAQAKPAEPVTPVTSAAPTPEKKRFKARAAFAAVLAALLVAGLRAARGGSSMRNGLQASLRTRPPRPRGGPIVVLPFANLSGDPGQDYLVDALTDELTTSLCAPPRHLRHPRATRP